MATPVAQPRALGRPPAADVAWLAIAVLFISSSGPIIAAIVAPALAIAFWRTLLGSAATAPWVLFRHRAEVARLTRREWRLIAIAGLLLGAHFATWIPSLRFTTVASSTALVATQPVWAALIARYRGVQVPRTAWIGIGIALVGVLVLTGVDLSVDPRHLIGDALALAGAVLAAAYVTVSERARATVSTATLTTGLYGTASILLLALCLIGGQALVGYSAQDWVLILLLTAGAQLLAHPHQQGARHHVGDGGIAGDPVRDARRHDHRRLRAGPGTTAGDPPRGDPHVRRHRARDPLGNLEGPDRDPAGVAPGSSHLPGPGQEASPATVPISVTARPIRASASVASPMPP